MSWRACSTATERGLDEKIAAKKRNGKESDSREEVARSAVFRQQAEAAQDLQLGIDEACAHHSIDYEYQVERYKTSNDLGMNLTTNIKLKDTRLRMIWE